MYFCCSMCDQCELVFAESALKLYFSSSSNRVDHCKYPRHLYKRLYNITYTLYIKFISRSHMCVRNMCTVSCAFQLQFMSGASPDVATSAQQRATSVIRDGITHASVAFGLCNFNCSRGGWFLMTSTAATYYAPLHSRVQINTSHCHRCC